MMNIILLKVVFGMPNIKYSFRDIYSIRLYSFPCVAHFVSKLYYTIYF